MKKILSMFLTLCMVLTLLPVTALAVAAPAVSVGGETLDEHNQYATTDAGTGAVTTAGATEANYNVKFEAGTLTLRNANISYDGSDVYAAIQSPGDLTIVAVGTNSVSRSGGEFYPKAIHSNGGLTLQGSGALTATSQWGVAVYGGNLTVKDGITLTAVGGEITSDQIFGRSLFAGDTLIVEGSATVTAVGGAADTDVSSIAIEGKTVTIRDNAAVTAVGGDTSDTARYSAGISAGGSVLAGAITIDGNAKVVAVGGQSGSGGSYGLYVGDGTDGTGAITYNGGLLVAKGGKATTSLSMNKVLGGSADAAVTTNESAATTDASRYCVVSPKTDGTVDYHVVTVGVSTSARNETAGHIEWSDSNRNLALTNTVVIAPDGEDYLSTALDMNGVPAGATLTLEGFNVLLAGDSLGFNAAVDGGGSHSDLTITGDGDLTAISGSSSQCYGIVNAKELSATGAITAIGGGYTYGYGISNYYPLSISAGKVIAIGSGGTYSYGIHNTSTSDGTHSISGGSGVAVGRNSALNAAPTLDGVSATGAYSSKLMAWGPVYIPPSATPAASITTVAKTAATQASVAFTLTTYPTGTYKVYADNATSSIHGEVTASLSGSTLTLTHASDIPAGSYYVSVTETGKAESTRLPLTVGEYVATCRLTVNLNGGNGSTTDGDYTAGTVINIDAGTKANHSFSGWTSSGGGSFGNQSSSSTTFTMPPNDTTITANWSYSGYTPPASAPSAPVIVDGKTENIGTEKKTGDTTTVTVDQSKLGTNIGGAAAGSSVVVPVSESGTATASLMVKNIAEMAEKGMTLTVQTGGVAYNLNSSAIDTAALTAAFPGADMSKVPFDVTIANSSVSVEGETLVLSPVAFTVTATYDGKTVDVDTFSAYIDRVIEVTAEQAAKITTAVVVNADGSVRHVPTNVIEKDGKYYAVVSSRTNSTYALIQNDVTFSDAAGKWYEAAVNEMGSRKIIAGRSASAFDGDAGITRAEFAVILVRALGLPADGISTFSDVPADAWYSGAVATAVTYSIVSGKGDNQFDPDANITRQEAMLMLQRASVLTEFTGAAGNLDSFADAGSVGTWAQDAAKWSVGSGLIQGSDGKLNPTADITRAESATIILRLLQKAGLVGVRSEA